MARRACGLTTTRITTRLSSLAQTGTTSKSFATSHWLDAIVPGWHCLELLNADRKSDTVLYAPFDPVPTSDVRHLKDTGRLYTVGDGCIQQAAYNLVEFKLSHRILSDLRLRMRLAIAHAIDKETLVKHVWYGFGKASIGPIPSTLKASYMRLAA